MKGMKRCLIGHQGLSCKDHQVGQDCLELLFSNMVVKCCIPFFKWVEKVVEDGLEKTYPPIRLFFGTSKT